MVPDKMNEKLPRRSDYAMKGCATKYKTNGKVGEQWGED